MGSCHSDKRLRIYTKGRALGDPMSPWIRSELVLKHSKRFILPLEILTHSTPYLAAAYSTTDKAGPFQFLTDSEPSSRLKTASQTIQISLAHQIRYGKRAVGKLVTTLKTLGYSDSTIVGILSSSGTPAPLINSLELLNRFS